MTHALLIAGHGSRDPDGLAEFLELARQFRAQRSALPTEVAFLEFARPTIAEGIDRLARRGVDTIVVQPGVLMAAGHAKNDMASEVRQARELHPRIQFHMGAALDVDAQLLQLCRLRYQEALRGRPEVDPQETLLLLVGRGSSDPDANSNIAKVAHFLKEGYPVGWAAVAYSGVARPLLDEALPVVGRMGFRRVVVQPYFLFNGVLLKRIYATVERFRQERPDLEVIAAPHLQTHPLLLDAFARRAEESLHGTGHMNCSLCQYRVAIIGHEGQLGQVQQGHHHHVEGVMGHVHRLDNDGEDLVAPHPWHDGLLERLRF